MEDLCLPIELVGFLKLCKVKGTPDFDIKYITDIIDVTLRWNRINSDMEDFCLPPELVGFLKLCNVKETPDFDIQHTKDTIIITLRWKRASPEAPEPSVLTTVPETPEPAPVTPLPQPRRPYEGNYQTQHLKHPKDFYPGHNWYGYQMYEYHCKDGTKYWIYSLDGAVKKPMAYWVYNPMKLDPDEAYFLTYPGTPEWDEADRHFNECDQYIEKTRGMDLSRIIDPDKQRMLVKEVRTMLLIPPEATGEPLQPIPYELRMHGAGHRRRNKNRF